MFQAVVEAHKISRRWVYELAFVDWEVVHINSSDEARGVMQAIQQP